MAVQSQQNIPKAAILIGQVICLYVSLDGGIAHVAKTLKNYTLPKKIRKPFPNPPLLAPLANKVIGEDKCEIFGVSGPRTGLSRDCPCSSISATTDTEILPI